MVGSGAIAGVIYQCAACRSLVSVRAIVVDNEHERAALSCDVCGARTWLPTDASGNASTSAGATVDMAPGASAPTALALALPASSSSSSSSSTALVPASASATAPATTWSADARARIDERIAKLPPSGDAQSELAVSFARLLSTWSSEHEHKQFLKKASMVGELAFAGQRYRAVLTEAPNDERAKHAQNDILGLAMASMSREKDLGGTASDDGRGKKLAAAVIVLVGVLACIAIFKYLPVVIGGDDDGLLGPPVDDQGQNIAPPGPGR